MLLSTAKTFHQSWGVGKGINNLLPYLSFLFPVAMRLLFCNQQTVFYEGVHQGRTSLVPQLLVTPTGTDFFRSLLLFPMFLSHFSPSHNVSKVVCTDSVPMVHCYLYQFPFQSIGFYLCPCCFY